MWPARAQLAAIEDLGISMNTATDELLSDGVEFSGPFRQVLSTIDARRLAPGALER